jgi:EmrB/QacA subfamily drug resistance transporter
VNDYSRKWWALAAVGSGVLISTIDGSIVNIALNTLVRDFNSNLNIVSWVVLAYLLTLTCLLLLMGRLGDMFGKRRIYVAGFVIFTVASVLCGLAPNIGALIGFRVLQAVGAAMIQALGPALLVTAFPPQERGTALGATGSIVAAGILIGPALGGVLLSNVSWQSIFYVNVPVGIAGIWLSLQALPKDTPAAGRQQFDIIGAALVLASLLGLLVGLTLGPDLAWSNPLVVGSLALFLVAGGLFIWWEGRVAQPMINLRMFTRPAFSFNLLAGFILFNGLAFNLLLVPLFLQLVYLLPLETVGLVLISLPLALSVTSPLSGRLSDRVGPRLLTVVGLVITAIGFVSQAGLRADTPLPWLIGNLMLLGVGIGLFQSPNNSTILGNAPPEALGVASGVLAVMRNLGQTCGIAIAGAVWASQVAMIAGQRFDPVTSAPPDILAAGFDRTMYVAAGLALLAIIPSILGGRAVGQASTPEAKRQAAD